MNGIESILDKGKYEIEETKSKYDYDIERIERKRLHKRFIR